MQTSSSYQQFKRFKRLLEPILWFLALGAFIQTLEWWNVKITDGFSHEAILGPFPPYEEGHLTSLTAQERAQVESLFSQPFRYFAKGGQCFVLESHDGSYVLKCLRQQHLDKISPLHLVEYVPFLKGYATQHLERRKERRRKRYDCMIVGCHIAYERLREATGILYLHLAPTRDLPFIQVIDYRGVVKELDPNQFPFFLQKKGSILRDGLANYRQNEDLEGAKQALHEVFVYLAHRSQCEVLDADPGYIHNLGWIDGKGSNLDIGKFFLVKEPSRLHEELTVHLAILRTCLQKEYPELVSAFDEECAGL